MRQSYRFMQSIRATACMLACKAGPRDPRLAAGHFHIGKGVAKVVSSAAIRGQEKLITVQAPMSNGGASARHRPGQELLFSYEG